MHFFTYFCAPNTSWNSLEFIKKKMANTKHSTAREIIIDRLLRKRRGYSVYEILDIVNESLNFEGFGPVSITTIRRDLDTIRFRYKQKLEAKKKSHNVYFRYEDPDNTIFNNVLTFGEIQQIQSALLAIRFSDELQGTLMYKELSKRLADMFDLDPGSDPVVLYKHIPSTAECKRYRALYEYIRTKTPISITYYPSINEKQRESTIHPYFILKDESTYYLLGHDSDKNAPIKIPISNIVRMHALSNIPFIPNKDFPLQDFYTKHIRID